MLNSYFLLFDITKKLNYNFIIGLYDIASYNTEEQCFNIVEYRSIRELAETLCVSSSQLNRLLNDQNYSEIFTHDKKDKIIKIHNNFKSQTDKKPFVILTQKEVRVLRKYNDNLLYKYFIYIKYYCGYSSKPQDFTAKQFLSACGYSTKSNSYISKISEFNTYLKDNGLINIKKYTDKQGFKRNIYSLY